MKQVFFSLLILLILQYPLSAQNDNRKYSDGLQRSIPELQGVKSQGIFDFVESIEKKNVELHSFMLLRHGKVVAEGWWNPYQPDVRHIMYSVSKTYTSTAVGFAITENLISLDDKVVSFFPEYETVYSGNLYTKKLTIRDLLTMSAGEEPFKDFRLRDTDWIQLFLNADLNAETANKFTYNSYATYMLSAILQRVTGKNMLEFLKPRLFDPLGIKNITSEQSPSGIVCGGWGMSVTTVDIAKLGQLYLQKGKWDGKQLLPESWIREATKSQIDTEPYLTDEEKEKSDWAQGYGYLMWRCRNNAFRADGSFGQFIIVMPDQDAVLAMTANVNDMQNQLQQVWDYILPAISDKKLAEDKQAYKALTNKLNTLALTQPSKNVIVRSDINNLRGIYTMEHNDLGIRSLGFKEQGDSCILTIRTTDATHNLVCGNYNWKYNITDKNSPYYNANYRNPIGLSPFVVAGYYGWKDTRNMLLKFLYLEDSSSENYQITFDGKRIIVLLKTSEDPQALPIRLLGHLN